MGLLDKAINKIAKNNFTYLPYNKMAELVKTNFIVGAKPEYLKKVAKAAKGGRSVDSLSGKYELTVGASENMIWITALFNAKRAVIISEKGTKNYYRLDKVNTWKKFYKAVMADIEAAK